MTLNHNIKVLVLDDEPFMLKLLARMLRNLGLLSVSTLDNGQAALDAISNPSTRPDLILLDLNMPIMDGVEFVRHLVDLRYTGSLILVSGEDERMLQAAEKLTQAHGISVLGHLHKPASPEGLAQLIDKWMPPAIENPARVAKKIYSADDVRNAIANGELINYYQPKVMLKGQRVVGVETLVRWQHPTDGMVFPDQFIGVAEKHGMADDLTRQVLGNALAQALAWQETGLTLHVAVNLSMDNLRTLDFLDEIVDLTERAGVAPQRMVLEVTESQFAQDLRIPLEILTRLRLKRFSISIDDFGTGNSSLVQLRDMPFDELKIDQGFVHGACDNEKLRAMYFTCLDLGKQLGMQTVAEGIEDQADWDFVSKSGCDIAQGYFIAKPMPVDAIPEWIRSWQDTSKVSS